MIIIYVGYSKQGKIFTKSVGIDNVTYLNCNSVIWKDFEKNRWGISLETSCTSNWFRIQVE